jgi:SEFIR domain-containing protein
MCAETVFISYSHDSTQHSDRVLALTKALIEMGLHVELDQFVTSPEHGWPSWCEERLRPENAAFVPVICTPTYRDRMLNKVSFDEGRGAHWEGALIHQYIYDEKGNKRFIPVLLGDAPDDSVPLPLRPFTRYRIKAFDLSDNGFVNFYRRLTRQPPVIRPGPGQRVELPPRKLSTNESAAEEAPSKERSASPPASISSVAGHAPKSTGPAPDPSDIEAFLGTDPIAGEDAIGPLVAAGPASLRALLARTTRNPQHVMRLRKLCSRLDAGSLDPLIDLIRSVRSEVELNSAAPFCFAVLSHNNKAGYAVYDLLKVSNFDVQRLAIEAAGHLGLSSGIRWELVRLAKHDRLEALSMEGSPLLSRINEYSFTKLYRYVIWALGRGFARTGESSELDYIREFFEFCQKESSNYVYGRKELASGLEDLKPIAADQLIRDWLRRSEGPWAKLAVDALAHLRLGRAVEPVAACLNDPRPDLRIAAAICLGNTGSESAARSVSRAFTGSDGLLWAVSMLYWRDVEWPKSEQYVQVAGEDSEISAQMLVSLALRKHAAAPGLARRKLASEEPFLRGTGAIALAYSQPREAASDLSDLAEEASSEIERSLVIAAEILAGRMDRGDALHEALQRLTVWPQLRPFWRCHILAALRTAEGTSRRAKLWAELSHDDAPRIDALVGELADRATAHRQSGA